MPTKIITIAQQKGGAGKTTLAAQLAVGFSCARMRVATIDIDPQGSLTCWSTLRNDALQDANAITHVSTQGWRLRKEIDR
jgi:chromosome partitioning protein